MSKYQTYSTRGQAPQKREIHPIWRGVGFALIILIPILAYTTASLLYDANRVNGWVGVPQELIMRDWADPTLLVKLLMTVVLSILLYGLFSFFTFFIYGAFGPPRYGPYDAPPVQFTGKRYKR